MYVLVSVCVCVSTFDSYATMYRVTRIGYKMNFPGNFKNLKDFIHPTFSNNHSGKSFQVETFNDFSGERLLLIDIPKTNSKTKQKAKLIRHPLNPLLKALKLFFPFSTSIHFPRIKSSRKSPLISSSDKFLHSHIISINSCLFSAQLTHTFAFIQS